MPVVLDTDFTRAEGVHNFGPFNLPNQADILRLRLARQTTAQPTFWPAGVFVDFQAQVALNGSDNWQDAGGFQAEGGVRVVHGVELEFTTMTIDFAQFGLGGPSRRIRFQLTVTGGPITSHVGILLDAA